ncbi:MAG: chorismate-binding protein [Luteolibacter sp.]
MTDYGISSIAWLARHDGSVVVGHGPMSRSNEAPADGVAFYLRPFEQVEDKPWRIPLKYEVISQDELARRFPVGETIDCQWKTMDTVAFSEVFQEVVDAIRKGSFEKTVPVVTQEGHCHHFNALELMGYTAACRQPLYSYAFCEGNHGFTGATPEFLLAISGKELQTMALAGTARSEDRDIFAVDEKEIREHEYVAQTLETKLHDLGSLERDDREILDLGPIVHFLTRIRVHLSRNISPSVLLDRLHPTPALGPLPRTSQTMRQLIEWRKRLGCPPHFGAPFGVWENGRFEAVVSIRGVWWNGERLQVPAGCGVIEASRMVNEWRELRLKREAVMRVIHCS